jgi:probable F420-dependent oxidoreductase
MKIDAGIIGSNLADVPERVQRLEAEGYDGVVSAEISSDPFFPLVLAAEHSQRIELMTSIAVAFARNPMLLANIGNDLQALSKGRFILGLGSQIAPHIAKRFSMPWSHPAARMREFILAMRAIWDCWYQGKPLGFRGDFYTHTLMTPMFTPTNNTYGPPRVVLAAVGPRMTEVAGEVADGMLVHAFTTQRYLQEVTLPAVERGLAKAGRARGDFQLCIPAFVVTGSDAKGWEQARVGVSRQIAFYGSTPAYRGVLELHGWGALQNELNALSKQGKWAEMGDRINDDILEEFAIVAEPKQVASRLAQRFGGVVDRLLCTAPFEDDAGREAFFAELRRRRPRGLLRRAPRGLTRCWLDAGPTQGAAATLRTGSRGRASPATDGTGSSWRVGRGQTPRPGGARARSGGCWAPGTPAAPPPAASRRRPRLPDRGRRRGSPPANAMRSWRRSRRRVRSGPRARCRSRRRARSSGRGRAPSPGARGRRSAPRPAGAAWPA